MITRAISCVIFSTCMGLLAAGQDSSNYYLLKVIHQEKEREYYIDQGEKLILRVSTDQKKHKGILDSVSVDSIYLNSEQFGINQVRMIMSKQMKSSLHFSNFMHALAGAILTTGGSILIVMPGPLSTYAGIGGIALGVPLLVKGVVRYFRSNHLWMKKGWEVSTISYEDAVSPYLDEEL